MLAVCPRLKPDSRQARSCIEGCGRLVITMLDDAASDDKQAGLSG